MPAQPLQLEDQFVDLNQERIAIRMRQVSDQIRRVLRKTLFARHARPAADLAVSQQGKAPQIPFPACMPKIAEEVVETESQGRCRRIHVAAQH